MQTDSRRAVVTIENMVRRCFLEDHSTRCIGVCINPNSHFEEMGHNGSMGGRGQRDDASRDKLTDAFVPPRLKASPLVRTYQAHQQDMIIAQACREGILMELVRYSDVLTRRRLMDGYLLGAELRTPCGAPHFSTCPANRNALTRPSTMRTVATCRVSIRSVNDWSVAISSKHVVKTQFTQATMSDKVKSKSWSKHISLRGLRAETVLPVL